LTGIAGFNRFNFLSLDLWPFGHSVCKFAIRKFHPGIQADLSNVNSPKIVSKLANVLTQLATAKKEDWPSRQNFNNSESIELDPICVY
jgi:hypothetical protein